METLVMILLIVVGVLCIAILILDKKIQRIEKVLVFPPWASSERGSMRLDTIECKFDRLINQLPQVKAKKIQAKMDELNEMVKDLEE